MIAAFVRLSIAAVAALAAPVSPSTPATHRQLLSSLHCTPFKWVSSGGNPHGALLIPITLNRVHYWFQLDTGSDGTILYGSEAAKRKWATADANWLTARQLKLGGSNVGPADIFILKNMPQGG